MQTETESVENFLAHYGVKGMRWGVRKSRTDGVSPKVDRAAAGDAKEFARAKLFYGEGAGTRRKLIKAKVETRKKSDPAYAKAFDNHFAKQDLGKHADKAKGERRRKDTKASIGKNARAVNRMVNGPFAGPVALAAITSGAAYVKSSGLDKRTMAAVRKFSSNQAMKRDVNRVIRGL